MTTCIHNTKLQTEQILHRTNKQQHEKMTNIKLENVCSHTFSSCVLLKC